MHVRVSLLALTGLASIASAQDGGPYTVSESGRGFATLAQAVEAIGDRDGTIVIAPGTYKDCAVQTAGRIAFVAKTPGTAIFDGAICEGKATLVLRGREAHVEGLTFTHTVVPDGNGAGIRLEKGNLTVVSTRFVDGQCGILTGDNPSGTIKIDHATFSGLGKHPDGNGAHALYAGHYGRLTVTNSRFERGTGGHYLKSRAANVDIASNSFDDSRGSATNYLIDLPEGSGGRIVNNIFVNGAGKENHSAMIAVSAEAHSHSSEGLIIEGNRASVVPAFLWSTVFAANWSGQQLVLRNNIVAQGIKLTEAR